MPASYLQAANSSHPPLGRSGGSVSSCFERRALPLSDFSFLRFLLNSLPTSMQNPWWNFACSQPPFATDSWDLSPCFQEELSFIPFAILVAIGGLAFPTLASRYRNGDLPEKGGKSAYSVKVVRRQPSEAAENERADPSTSALPEQAAAGALVLAQLGYLITVIIQSHHIWHDVRLPFGILALTSYVRLSETRVPFGRGGG